MKKKILTAFVVLFMTVVAGCVQEAETVDPEAVFNPATGSDPGTTEMSAYLASPANGSSNVAPDADIIITFSAVADSTTLASATGNLTITDSLSVPIAYVDPPADGRTITITPSSNFDFSETITINLTTGVQSTAGDPLGSAYTWTFDVISDHLWDPTAYDDPNVIPSTRYPTGTGISINTSYVEVTFSEAVLNVNTGADGTTGTFTISPAVGSACSVVQVPGTNTYRLDFGGTQLAYGTTYTVDLTNGITDADANPLNEDGQDTWTFQTEAAPGGLPTPVAIEPNSVYVNNVEGTTAELHWTTNKPVPDTGCTIDFGTDTGYGTNVQEDSTGTGITVHSYTFPGTLSENTKYYYLITVNDGATTDTITGSFFTGGAGIPPDNPGLAVKDNSGNNSGIAIVQNTDATGTENGSSIAVWLNDDANYIFGYHYDTSSPPNPNDWVANGASINENASSNVKIFRDNSGYAIVTYENGGHVYAKRIRDNGGLEFDNDWGDAAAAGVDVAIGASPSAARPGNQVTANNVYGGFVTKIVSGTATMDIPTDSFYDFANDLSGIANGDHIMDGSYNHTTVGALSTNFRHVIGQTAVTVAASDTYYIASSTSTVSDIATDHVVGVTNYSNGGTNVYTEHGFPLPGWGIDADDIIQNTATASWGLVTGVPTVINIVNPGDCATHPAETTDFYNIPILPNALVADTEGFTVYDGITTGTADTPPANPLYDDSLTSGVDDYITLGVVANDVVINTTDYAGLPHPNIAKVRTAPFAVAERALDLDMGIMADGETYELLRFADHTQSANILETGSATEYSPSKLVDGTNGDFVTAGVAKGDLVYNITDETYAVVTNPEADDTLDLNKDIFDNGNEEYLVFSSDQPLVETGTVTTAGNPFTDSNANFTNVQVGDEVYNQDTSTQAYVTGISGQQLTLSSAIMNLNDHYIVVRPGILFAYVNANNILGEVIGINDGVSQRGFNICTHGDTMANVYARPALNGQIFVVYEDNTNGQIYGKLVDTYGNILVGGVVGDRGVSVTGAGTFDMLDVQVWDNPTNSWIYVLYTNGTDIYLARLNQDFDDVDPTEWTYSVEGTNGDFTIDSSGNPILAYVDTAGDIIVTKLDEDDDGAVLNTETISTSLITTEILSLSIVPDGSDGSIIAWADDRYYTVHGYVVMAQRVDSTGSALWNSDSAGSDYTGILAGITETNNDLEVTVEQGWYNDGSVILWYDYRNIRTDIFYQAITNAGVPQY